MLFRRAIQEFRNASTVSCGATLELLRLDNKKLESSSN
jgi:hypothetical protein